MARLEWSNDLNTGIDVIDGQHRRIVDYINQIDDARKGHNRAAVSEIIDATVDYTLSHFGFEETLMEDAGYEFVRPHKKVHELFTRRVGELQARHKAGENVIDDLHGLLSRWLFSHIKNDDAGYVKAVKATMKTLTEEKQEGGWLARSLGRFSGALNPRAMRRVLLTMALPYGRPARRLYAELTQYFDDFPGRADMREVPGGVDQLQRAAGNMPL